MKSLLTVGFVILSIFVFGRTIYLWLAITASWALHPFGTLLRVVIPLAGVYGVLWVIAQFIPKSDHMRESSLLRRSGVKRIRNV